MARQTPSVSGDGVVPSSERNRFRQRANTGTEGAGAREERAWDGPLARTSARDGEARMKRAAALVIVAAISAGAGLAAQHSGFTRTPLQDQPISVARSPRRHRHRTRRHRPWRGIRPAHASGRGVRLPTRRCCSVTVEVVNHDSRFRNFQAAYLASHLRLRAI
jgi:hypothetical protein